MKNSCSGVSRSIFPSSNIIWSANLGSSFPKSLDPLETEQTLVTLLKHQRQLFIPVWLVANFLLRSLPKHVTCRAAAYNYK